MGSDYGSDSAKVSHKRGRMRLRRVAGWGGALVLLLLLGTFGLVERIAHRPSPVRMTLTAAEIEAESTQLKQAGLIVPGGSFLKEHPFEPPWTSHSLLVPSGWSSEPFKALLGSHFVRADLLLADLDVLEPVMERAYGGWDSGAARGWNWDQWFSDWRKKLAQKGSTEISFDEAFAPIDALIAFQRDNHTQIPLSRWTTGAGSQTALLSGAPNAPCTEIRAGNQFFSIAADDAGQQVRTAKAWRSGAKSFLDAKYISMPTSYGTPQAVNCGGVWIGLQQVGNRAVGGLFLMLNRLRQLVKPDRPRIERIGEGIVYARLPAFSWSNYEHLSRVGWAKRQPGDRVLIVDLRGNGGGDGQYGLDVLKDWVDETKMVPFEDIGSQLTSSCLYEPLRWNEAVQSTPGILPSQKKSLQTMLDRMAQPYPPGCPRTEDIKAPKWTYLQRRFEPKPGDLRIIALVNSGCGSDCEWITAGLASLRQTIVMGTNTYGVLQFIQPGYSVLPHTGLRYRIALGRSDYYGDNRSVDGYGLDVDVVIPEVSTLKPGQLREIAKIVANL